MRQVPGDGQRSRDAAARDRAGADRPQPRRPPAGAARRLPRRSSSSSPSCSSSRSSRAGQTVDGAEKHVYYVALLLTAISSICFIAPTARHRLRFRERDLRWVVESSNRLMVAGLIALGGAIAAVLLLITMVVFSDGFAIAVCVAFAVVHRLGLVRRSADPRVGGRTEMSRLRWRSSTSTGPSSTPTTSTRSPGSGRFASTTSRRRSGGSTATSGWAAISSSPPSPATRSRRLTASRSATAEKRLYAELVGEVCAFEAPPS